VIPIPYAASLYTAPGTSQTNMERRT